MGTALTDHATRHACAVVASTRQDLFGLSDDRPLGPTGFSQAIDQLAAFGLAIHQRGPGHWIIRSQSPLPEIHCYSEREIIRFARLKGRHYGTTQPEERHEYPDIPG